MMNPSRKISVAAIAAVIAAHAEGIRQVAYRDPVGILTVCYGDTHNVIAGRVYSMAECKKRLDEQMLVAVNAVDKCAPNLPDNVLAAFSDAVYNMGPTIACDKSKSSAARLLAAGNYKLACTELPNWNKAKVAGVSVVLPGLTKRRNEEMQLCLKE